MADNRNSTNTEGELLNAVNAELKERCGNLQQNLAKVYHSGSKNRADKDKQFRHNPIAKPSLPKPPRQKPLPGQQELFP